MQFLPPSHLQKLFCTARPGTFVTVMGILLITVSACAASGRVTEAVIGDSVPCTGGEADGYECSNVDLLAFLPISAISSPGTYSELNDIWGWTDPQTGREYAIVGRTDGVSFVDISDPVNPRYVGDLPRTPGSQASTWRDMKVYRDHVYVVADNAARHGMQVFDLTELRDVQGEPETFSATALYTDINSAHNIVINEETGFAYTVGNSGGGETCGGGLHMINIQDPANPAFAGCFADRSTGIRRTGYTHDAQCVVYRGPDQEHTGKEICLGSNETALSIADVTDKENPVALSSASYPSVSYTHQGWLSEDQRYFYVNDEGDELERFVPYTRTLIWDVSDLDDPQMVKEYMFGVQSTDHNLYIRGNYMYQANYSSGLRVHDISDPENPVETGYFDTTPGLTRPGYDGAWSTYPYFESGNVIVSSSGEGLFILRPVPRVIGEAPESSDGLLLSPAFANPFSVSTVLELTVGRLQEVTVAAYDMLGREVARLHNGPLAPGAAHTLTFDASALPAGSYVIRAEGEEGSRTQVVRLVK
jgi:choice-of-anchor B domain-containing protein